MSRQGHGSQTWFLQPFHTVCTVLVSTNVSENGRVKSLALSRTGHLVFKVQSAALYLTGSGRVGLINFLLI